MGLSQQFETQHDIPSKVLYVQGGWLSSFAFKVTFTRFELEDEFSSLDVRIGTASLLWSTSAPPCSHVGGYKGPDDHLLAALRDIAADPSQCSSRWLGHFHDVKNIVSMQREKNSKNNSWVMIQLF